MLLIHSFALSIWPLLHMLVCGVSSLIPPATLWQMRFYAQNKFSILFYYCFFFCYSAPHKHTAQTQNKPRNTHNNLSASLANFHLLCRLWMVNSVVSTAHTAPCIASIQFVWPIDFDCSHLKHCTMCTCNRVYAFSMRLFFAAFLVVAISFHSGLFRCGGSWVSN